MRPASPARVQLNLTAVDQGGRITCGAEDRGHRVHCGLPCGGAGRGVPSFAKKQLKVQSLSPNPPDQTTIRCNYNNFSGLRGQVYHPVMPVHQGERQPAEKNFCRSAGKVIPLLKAPAGRRDRQPRALNYFGISKAKRYTMARRTVMSMGTKQTFR